MKYIDKEESIIDSYSKYYFHSLDHIVLYPFFFYLRNHDIDSICSKLQIDMIEFQKQHDEIYLKINNELEKFSKELEKLF